MLQGLTSIHLRNAVITLRSSGFEFLQITMEDVLISSYELNGNEGGSPAPLEQIKVNFAQIEFMYRSPVTGQTARDAFDFKEGRTV